METRTSTAVLCAAFVIAAATHACGGDVQADRAASGGGTGSGSGGTSAVGATSSSSAGGAAASSCEAQQGVCVSLDLPACPDGRVSVSGAGHACDDPDGSGDLSCCVPAADACANATEVDLGSGTVSISGDTTAAADEHPSLTCDSPHVGFTLDQGQFYFRFEAEAGAAYQFTLQTSFYGFLYVFPAAVGCSLDAIQASCSSDGATGMISGIVNPGASGSWLFAPQAAGPYVFAVDGDTSPGPFEVTLTKQ